MLTPAQNPRGLARMIFTQTSLSDADILPRAGFPANRAPQNSIATLAGWRCRGTSELLPEDGYSYSNFETVTISFLLLLSFLTVPVTLPFLPSSQMSLWYFLWLSLSKQYM